LIDAAKADPKLLASMRPPRIAAEYAAEQALSLAHGGASMRPPRIAAEYSTRHAVDGRHVTSFNEAAANRGGIRRPSGGAIASDHTLQ